MITIFTPAYNRAYILPELYKSLKQQTCFDFEWLIVDDGSTDNTESLVSVWQMEEKNFSIRYIKQKNGGKHRAINTGVSAAKGEGFFIVDSDDMLTSSAVESILKVFASVKADEHFAGVCGLRANPKTLKPLSKTGLLKEKTDCSMIDISRKYHISGDMAEVFKTEVLKKYPFPCFEGENFISEGVVWRKIAYKYILRYVPEIWYLCEYLSDGLTKNIRKRFRKNPQGTIYLLNMVIREDSATCKEKLRAAVLYWRYLCFNRLGYKEAVWWTYIFLPAGLFYYLRDIL